MAKQKAVKATNPSTIERTVTMRRKGTGVVRTFAQTFVTENPEKFKSWEKTSGDVEENAPLVDSAGKKPAKESKSAGGDKTGDDDKGGKGTGNGQKTA